MRHRGSAEYLAKRKKGARRKCAPVFFARHFAERFGLGAPPVDGGSKLGRVMCWRGVPGLAPWAIILPPRLGPAEVIGSRKQG
jgi:hypothetical protein